MHINGAIEGLAYILPLTPNRIGNLIAAVILFIMVMVMGYLMRSEATFERKLLWVGYLLLIAAAGYGTAEQVLGLNTSLRVPLLSFALGFGIGAVLMQCRAVRRGQ